MKLGRIPLVTLGYAACLFAANAAASDWTPSTAPAMPGDAPTTVPSQPPYDAPLPPQLPPQLPPPPAWRGGGFGGPGGETAPQYDPETDTLSFELAGLRFTQSRTDDAYLLDIELEGLPAEQLQVRPAGSGVMLMVQRTAETSRAETFGDGYGYQRSWGYSSGQQVKRLPAPPDADVLAMEREDSADAVRITIPRRRDLSGYGAEAIPAQPAPETLPPPPVGQP